MIEPLIRYRVIAVIPATGREAGGNYTGTLLGCKFAAKREYWGCRISIYHSTGAIAAQWNPGDKRWINH